MTRTAAVLFLLFTPLSGFTADEPLLSEAEAAFAHGVELRSDAVEAQPWFVRAAGHYDELWRRGHRTPELAMNRANAHRLAGDLPASIAAFHEGLAVARFHYPLQAGLEDARAAVAFPHDGELANECRPRTRLTVASRMSPLEAYWVTGSFWLAACGLFAWWRVSRNHGILPAVGIALAVLAAIGVMWWQDAKYREREDCRPLAIVREDAGLHKGNGDGFPKRFDHKLPRGVETRELSRRGGWVQVELAGGAVGWLPENAVLIPEAWRSSDGYGDR